MDLKGKDMRIIGCILIVTLLPLLGGCFYEMVDKGMAARVGTHYSELIESCGPPTRVIDDGRGGRIVCYERESANKGDTVYRMYWINDEGYIVKYSWRGLY